MDVLANRPGDLVVGVGVHVFGVHEVGSFGVLVELPAERADDDAGVDDRRPRDPSRFDRLAQRGVGVEAAVSQIALEREPVIEQREGIARALERAVRGGVGHEHLQQRRRIEHAIAELRRAAVERHRLHQRHRQVVVRFDQAGKDRQVRQIDCLRPWRDRHVFANRGNPAVLYHDGLIRARGSGLGIDQAPRPDRNRGRRSGRRRRSLLLRDRWHDQQKHGNRATDRAFHRHAPHVTTFNGEPAENAEDLVSFVFQKSNLNPTCCWRFGNSACG